MRRLPRWEFAPLTYPFKAYQHETRFGVRPSCRRFGWPRFGSASLLNCTEAAAEVAANQKPRSGAAAAGEAWRRTPGEGLAGAATRHRKISSKLTILISV